MYCLYKITNLLNNKIYIGIHKTVTLTDSYMGSGKLIKAAIRKYGKENFKKEILEIFKSEDEMVLREQEIVTEEFIKSNQTYNIMLGGKFGSKERNGLSFEGRTHTSESIDAIRSASIGRLHTDGTKKKLSKNNFSKRSPDRQREHARKAGAYIKTDAHRQKISDAIKSYVSVNGSKNTGKVREQIKCPYCDKCGAANTMMRWHFDKCKYIGGKSIGADPTL